MQNKSNLYRKVSSSFSLGAIALLTLTAPAWGEGSEQLGSGDQGLNTYLFEYNADNSFIQGSNRALKINVESAGQIINVSLCGWSTSDNLAIEVFRPSGQEFTYGLTQVAVGSPGSFSATAGNGNGAWSLAGGNARTLTQLTLCNNQSKPNSAASNLTTPVRFIAPEAGTYDIHLYNDSENNSRQDNVFTYFDITVTSLPSINPNPSANNGQLWATSWAFNAGDTFGVSGGYDADLYIRTPGGRLNTEFIWQLDLNNFAPFRHDIVANSIGLNPPDSRGSALGSSGASYNREFPIYLSPPNPTSTVLPILPEPSSPNITNFRFIDNADQDNTISPNSTGGTQDSGFFKFDSDIAGTYKITIDTNQSGTFDTGDRVLFGSATSGLNSIQWDGMGVNNATLPSGTYKAEINVGLGEYHFLAFDAETSGGGINDGLSIWQWNGSSRTPVSNYWDDTKISGGSSNLAGALSDTAAGKHTWGDFSGSGIGNTNFIDTWVFGSNQILETQTIIASTDDNDFGDALDTYGTDKDTTIGGTPASHLINPNLHLGTLLPDKDTDGQPTPNADGDDVNGTTPDDEDGIASFNPLNANTTSYSTTVTVKNTTGQNAYLAGWIDFNRDGIFQSSEGAVATIANNDTTATLTWSSLSGLSVGNTYARFRINNAPLTTSQFNSGGSDGEVEDYSLIISSPGNSISGKIFDDVNYGGGPGRNYAAANSSAISSGWSDGAIGSGSTVVELYKDILGNFVKVAQTTANSNGEYSFTGQSNGTYRIRVLNRTVSSVRPIDPTPIDIIPVQTFRNDPDEATEENRSIINEVGGRKPSVTDPTTIIPLSTPLPPNAQSYTEVIINNNGITNADFGFNFDTIVNTNSSGQGSLRQFIINSNVLGNLRLDQDESANSVAAQVTKNAGIEHSIFMIPNALDPLNRPADTGYTSASGLDGGSGNTFEIKLNLGELTVTAEKTAIDGRTQTALTGDTNSSSVGTSTGPEVVISGDDNLSIDLLTIAAEDVLVDSIGLVKAKNILVGASALGRGLVIGASNLIGITDPIIVRNSTISGNDTNGIQVNGFTSNAPSSIQIIDNVIRQNGQRSSLVSNIGSNYVGQFGNGIALLTNGLSLTNGSIKNIDILNNSISENRENGIKVLLATSPDIIVENLNIQNNTINNNGTGSSTAKDGISFEAVANASNVFLISSAIKNSQIIANEISENQGDGISLTANVGILSPIVNLLFDPISAVTISRNSIFENTDLGIDLEISPTITPQTGVTSNDDGDTDFGPNGLLNFPVFERAEIIAGNLVIEGWAPPESIIELFLADVGPSPNPLPSGYTTSFGEGQTYLLTLQEGGTNGISDTDATQSTYTNDGTGSTTTKAENRFQFTIPLSGGMLGGVPIANGTRLTATGTKNSSTSEFNGVTVVNPTPNDPNLLLVKRITRINGQTQNGSTNLDVYIDDDDYDYDDNTLAAPAPDPVDTENWPTPSDYLKGAINGGTTKPGDEIEYTIYFLSTGDKEAADVAICDRVPAFQTFVPDAFNSVSPAPNGGIGANRGILVEYDNTTLSYTNDANDDTAQYYPPGATLPAACDNLSPQTDERDDNGNPVDNGTVVVNLGDIPNADGPGTPDDSYGLIRFRAKVK